jgi:hypothetical protein
MSDVGLALAGAVVGAAATGVAQIYLGRRDRAVESRAAARVLWASGFEARVLLEKLLEEGTWGGYEGFDRYIDTWRSQRKSLARHVDDLNYHKVSVAFGNLQQLQFGRGPDIRTDPLSPASKGQVKLALRSLQRTSPILFAAGQTWVQRHRPEWLNERRERALEAAAQAIYGDNEASDSGAR